MARVNPQLVPGLTEAYRMWAPGRHDDLTEEELELPRRQRTQLREQRRLEQRLRRGCVDLFACPVEVVPGRPPHAFRVAVGVYRNGKPLDEHPHVRFILDDPDHTGDRHEMAEVVSKWTGVSLRYADKCLVLLYRRLRAAHALLELLREGPVHSAILWSRLEEMGITHHEVCVAQDRLGVVHELVGDVGRGGYWVWRLPP